MEYNVTPDKQKPILIVTVLFGVGLAIAMAPLVFDGLPQLIFQCLGMIVLSACILILSRYVLTGYSYQLYDTPNQMSEYPKLNVYRIRKTDSKMAYCIPFHNIIAIFPEKRKLKIKRENLCASMKPAEVYTVIYWVEDHAEAVYLECNAAFAAEIGNRIEVWSQVQHMKDEY